MPTHPYIEVARRVEYDARVLRMAVTFLLLVLPSVAAGQDQVPPKVAVIVAGDPDAPLRDAARRLDEALAAEGSGVRVPADAGLRDALRGETGPTTIDDGLGGVRALRRRLGRSEADDLPSLLELARVTGAVALVVVRVPLGETGVEAVVLAVRAQQFFVGGIDPSTATVEVMQHYVAVRAHDESGLGTSSPSAPAAPAPASPPAHPAPSAHPAPAAHPGAHPNDDIGMWLSRNWVYVLVGAIVGAGAIGLIVASQPSEPGAPVLRFQLGSGS